RTVILVAILAAVVLIARQIYRQRGGFSSPGGRFGLPADSARATPVEGPYFSYGDRVAGDIVAAIHSAQKILHAATYSFTEPEIALAVEAGHRRGLDIRIIADEGQARDYHSQIPRLEADGISVRLTGGYRGNRSLMHDKFAVFDGRLVVTGSFNWTIS